MSFAFIWNNGEKKCLKHLVPFSINTIVDGVDCEILIDFGHHCYTDEKENGDRFAPIKTETRYFSPERYAESFRLPELISNLLGEKTGHITAYHNDDNQECYYHVDYLDYSIYMTIKKPANTTNRLKVRVISAYDQDEWGSSPGGKTVGTYFLLSERLKGNQILKKKKRKS